MFPSEGILKETKLWQIKQESVSVDIDLSSLRETGKILLCNVRVVTTSGRDACKAYGTACGTRARITIRYTCVAALDNNVSTGQSHCGANDHGS